MKKSFKIKYLSFVFAAALPIAAVAADGPVGKGPSAEERKARIDACKANPEQCRAEWQARMAQRQAERQAHFEQRFKQADSDGDGAINRAEADKALPHLAQHFDRVDANQDGRVTLEEMNVARQAAKRAHFEQRFKRADGNGDGKLSRAEAEQAVPPMSHLARHFDRIDADKDGQVTFEEIAAVRKVRSEQRHHRGQGSRL